MVLPSSVATKPGEMVVTRMPGSLSSRSPSVRAHAANLVALYTAGVYEGAEIDKGLVYLGQFLPQGDDFNRQNHYFYGHYYAVQAMWIKGGQRTSRLGIPLAKGLVGRLVLAAAGV